MIADQLDSMLDRYICAVCPIFVRESSGIVDALGSGVLIALGSYKFLVTAAHVTDRARTGDLLVPGADRLTYLQGFHASGKRPASNDRNDDLLDIAYFRLQEPFTAELNPFFTFLNIDDLDLFDTTKFGDVYSMIGFPGGQASIAGEPLSRERFNFIGDARDPKLYHKHGYDTEHHILLHFHRKKIKRLGAGNQFGTHYRDIAPEPDGMSGCAVVAWSRVTSPTAESLPNARLAGILTTYHPSEHTFAATRINCFIHCILKNHPEIPVTYAGFFTHHRNA